MNKSMGLVDAASFLGISTRQVQRDVRDGKLSARGGGRGVPLVFRMADLAKRLSVLSVTRERFGVFNADLLARAVHALHRLQENPADKGFPEYETQNAWRMWRRKSPGVQFVQNCFPALIDVPGDVLETVRGLCDGLGPAELDYLGGMVVAVAHPWRVHQPEEKWSLWMGDKLAAIPDRRVWELVENAISSGDVELLRDLIERDRKQGSGDSFGAEADKAFAAMRGDDGKTQPELLSACRKAGAAKREKGRGRPTGNRVCVLLGIHRTQGTRIATRIWNKWGEGGARKWFKLLGCPGARLWNKLIKGCQNKPIRSRVEESQDGVCASCGWVLDDWDVFCRGCGATFFVQRVGARAKSTSPDAEYKSPSTVD